MKPSELLSKNGAWCQGLYAIDKYDINCNPKSEDAVKWCAEGALSKCNVRFNKRQKLYDYVRSISPKSENLIDFNDAPSRKKKDVIKVLKACGL